MTALVHMCAHCGATKNNSYFRACGPCRKKWRQAKATVPSEVRAAAPEMLAELKKQLDWLKHIKPQIKAPDSVLMGFDQSIKYIGQLVAKAEGQS